MSVQEIFDTPAIRLIEIEILKLQYKNEKNWHYSERYREAIRHLMKVRKRLLDEMFELDEHYKQLLYDFNEAMESQLLVMRNRAFETMKVIAPIAASDNNDLTVTGKCFLAYEYSKIHPVQSARARKMWDMLNGTVDGFAPLYDDEVCNFRVQWQDGAISCVSENQLLYLDEELDNWNEGLDREKTKDMHLTHAFHDLWEHVGIFSIFDLLWVRDFNIEISPEWEYRTYTPNEAAYPDWDKSDFFD